MTVRNGNRSIAGKIEASQRRSIVLFVAAISLIDPVAAAAQDTGQQLATNYCSACHRVAADQGLPPPVALDAGGATEFRQATSFRQIADNATMDRAALQNLVQQPHYAIPGQILGPEDRSAIVEYILALRTTPADW